MRKNLVMLAAVFGLIILLAACGGGQSGGAVPENLPGDPEAGKALFEQLVINDVTPGCISCHSVKPDEVLVGPSLSGIGSAAATRISGYSAEDYLRESIIMTDAYIAQGFQAGYMYTGYALDLNEQQLDDLVSYLLTLQ